MRTTCCLLLTAALHGCGGVQAGVNGASSHSEQAHEQLGSLAGGATAAIDPARCEKADQRLQPFVVSWDTTNQAEFAAQGQESLLVVKAQGCELELLPQCRVPGQYRLRPTPGGYQSLTVSSEGELYGKLSFSVVQLAGHVRANRSLSLAYFVSGVRYATAPGLYARDLPTGCEDATHFVLNYAAGAYELNSSAGRGGGAEVGVAGVAGVGAQGAQESAVLYRGGDLKSCGAGGFACTAPVRLRLLPILEGGGAPPEHKLALRLPKPGTVHRTLSAADVKRVVAVARAPMQACVRDSPLPRGQRMSFKTRFAIGADGVVTSVAVSGEGVPATALSCAEEVMYGLRFPASTEPTKVSYPWSFAAD